MTSVTNPKTGRKVKVGSVTYNKLIKEGSLSTENIVYWVQVREERGDSGLDEGEVHFFKNRKKSYKVCDT